MDFNKDSQDPTTGHIKQFTPFVVLSAFVIAALFGWFISFVPFYSTFFTYVAILITSIMGVSMIWLNTKPNLWASFIKYISISVTFSFIAFRSITYLVPDFALLVAIGIASSVLYAILMPIIDLETTKIIKSELYNPTKRFGIFVDKYIFFALGLLGIIGFALFISSGRLVDNSTIRISILGPLSWFLALLIPFSSAYPQSPWEYKRLKESKE